MAQPPQITAPDQKLNLSQSICVLRRYVEDIKKKRQKKASETRLDLVCEACEGFEDEFLCMLISFLCH